MPYFGPQVGITPIRPLDYSPISSGYASIGQAFQQMDARKRADQQLAMQQQQIDMSNREQSMREQQQRAALAERGFVSGDVLGDEIRQMPMPGVQATQPAVTLPGPTAARIPGGMPGVQVTGAPAQAPQPTAVMRLTQGAPMRATPAAAPDAVAETFQRLRSAMGGPQKVAMGDGTAPLYYDPARAAQRQILPELIRGDAQERLALSRLVAQAGITQQQQDGVVARKAQSYVGMALPNGHVITEQEARAIANDPGVLSVIGTQRNIDPNSDEGIRAAAKKAGAVAAAEEPFKISERKTTTGKPTEFNQKAALVYDRAREAANILDSFDQGATPHSLLGKVPLVGGYLTSADEQRFNNAGEILATAVLRLESGAAVTQQEARSYAHQFLPQVGDTPEVKTQKAEIRRRLVERIRNAAGPALSQTPPAAVATITPAERAALKASGFTDAQITAKYGPP